MDSVDLDVEDLTWLVGHLANLVPDLHLKPMPPRLRSTVVRCLQRYEPGRFTLADVTPDVTEDYPRLPRNDAGMVVGIWPAKAGEATVAMEDIHAEGGGGGLNVPSNSTDSPTPAPTSELDDECATCGEEEGLEGECPESQRPCGHHCNHSWTHDCCHWCGWEAEDDPEPVAGPSPAGTPETDHDG